jgi:hypothetical protein
VRPNARKRNLAVDRPRNIDRIFRRRINYTFEVRAQLRLRNNLELALFTRLQTLIRQHIRKQAKDIVDNKLNLNNSEKQFTQTLKATLALHYKRIFMAIYERNTMIYQNLQKKQDAFDFSNVNFEKVVAGYISMNELRFVGISETLTKKMRQIIDEGYRENLSSTEIARNLEREIPKISRIRALTIARTETHAGASYANHKYHMDIGDDLGVEFYKRWVAVSDGRTRPEHREANGQTVKINEKFKLSHPKKGTVFMDRAGDPSGGAYHSINCRCVITYGESLDDLD